MCAVFLEAVLYFISTTCWLNTFLEYNWTLHGPNYYAEQPHYCCTDILNVDSLRHHMRARNRVLNSWIMFGEYWSKSEKMAVV